MNEIQFDHRLMELDSGVLWTRPFSKEAAQSTHVPCLELFLLADVAHTVVNPGTARPGLRKYEAKEQIHSMRATT